MDWCDEFYFSFFDIPEKALPQNCEYYFNILTITVGVPVGTLQKTYGTTEFHDLSRLKDARPIYLYMYEDEFRTRITFDTGLGHNSVPFPKYTPFISKELIASSL